SAESANFAQNALGKSLVGQILDSLLGLVAAINADTGIGVGDRVVLKVRILGHVISPSLPGWRELVRHRAGGSTSGATNFNTSGVDSGFSNGDLRKRYNAGPIHFFRRQA